MTTERHHRYEQRQLKEICALPDSAWMTPYEAAVYLNTTPAALAIRRSGGTGPEYGRHGRFVRYRRKDIDEWMRSVAAPQPYPPTLPTEPQP